MRNAYRVWLWIVVVIVTSAAVFEALTKNYRCATYALCCAISICLLIRDDIFIEKITNEIKRIIKGEDRQ